MSEQVLRLRYQGNQEANDLVVAFSTDQTLHENLLEIFPYAQELKDFMPSDCQLDELRLYANGTPLNLNLRLKEQAPGASVLTIRRIVTAIELRIRYAPDHLEEQSRTITVNPQKPLEPQVRACVAEILSQYDFRGRRRRKYRLVVGGAALDHRKALVAEGHDANLTVTLRPRAVLGWPFRRLEYVLLSAVLLALALVAWRCWPRTAPPIETYVVCWTASDACRLEPIESSDSANGAIHVPARGETHVSLARGSHEFEVFPQSYPISHLTIEIPSAKHSNDTTWVSIDLASQWRNAPTLTLNVQGFWVSVRGLDPHVRERRIHSPVLINGFSYTPSAFGETEVLIPRGEYDVRMAIEEATLRYVELEGTRWHEFRHDLARYMHDRAQLNFYYERPAQPTSGGAQ